MSTITFDFRHYYRKGERRESDQIAYQWDLGHVAEIYVPMNATYEIHYCFADFTETDDYGVESITAAEDGGYKLTAHIPNELFERSGELKVYVIGADDNHILTTYEGYITIRGRAKPEDYVDDDPENEATRILTEAREARDAAIEAAEQAEAAASQSAAQASIAKVYDATATYAIGDYCLHDGQLYECTTEITTPEAWTAAHWTAATVGTELNDIQDDVSGLKEDLNNTLDIEWITGKYINNNGVEVPNNSFKSTDYILLSDVLYGIEYKLCLASNANIVSFYNAEKTYINGIAGAENNTQKTGVLVYPISGNIDNNAKYVRFSHCIASAGVTNPEPVILSKNIISNTMLSANSVKTVNIENESVTKSKTDFIIHDPTSNYIDKEQYSNGYISASGRFVLNNGWRATGYCKLLPNTHYYGSGLHGGYCAFYKSDLTVIQGYGASSFDISSFTTPAETAFARFSLNASSQSVDSAWIFTQNEKPKDYAYVLDGVGVYTDDDSNPCDYIGNEISVFNKILCVGDSMTEGTFNHLDSGSTQYINISKYAYPKYLHTITGVEVTNLGHGGQTSVQWYNTEKDNDLGGYDCAIVQLGINDFGTYGELGNDTKTAFQNIISKLKTQNKNIKIFVANIIPATSYSSDGYKQFSSDLLDWFETTYASDKDVIPLDIQQYGHTGDSSAYNCGHLSALGYHRLAEDYKGYISWYISKNKNVFREVQFIGTDYWYINPNT